MGLYLWCLAASMFSFFPLLSYLRNFHLWAVSQLYAIFLHLLYRPGRKHSRFWSSSSHSLRRRSDNLTGYQQLSRPLLINSVKKPVAMGIYSSSSPCADAAHWIRLLLQIFPFAVEYQRVHVRRDFITWFPSVWKQVQLLQTQEPFQRCLRRVLISSLYSYCYQSVYLSKCLLYTMVHRMGSNPSTRGSLIPTEKNIPVNRC